MSAQNSRSCRTQHSHLSGKPEQAHEPFTARVKRHVFFGTELSIINRYGSEPLDNSAFSCGKWSHRPSHRTPSQSCTTMCPGRLRLQAERHRRPIRLPRQRRPCRAPRRRATDVAHARPSCADLRDERVDATGAYAHEHVARPDRRFRALDADERTAGLLDNVCMHFRWWLTPIQRALP